MDVNRAISVDAPNVKVREDAFIILARPQGGWDLSIIIPFPHNGEDVLRLPHPRHEDIRWNYSDRLSVDTYSSAMSMDFMISEDGTITFMHARTCTCILEATYTITEVDCFLQSGGGHPFIRLLPKVTKVIRYHSSFPLNANKNIEVMLTACSAAAASFMAKQGRSLLYLSWKGTSAPRVLSLFPLPHAYGDFAAYARFTSPFRRREDKVNLACLLAASMDLPEPFDHATMARQCSMAAKTIKAAVLTT